MEHGLLQLDQQHRIDLRHRHHLLLSVHAALDTDRAIGELACHKVGAGQLSLHLGVGETPSNQTLEAADRVAEVCDLLDDMSILLSSTTDDQTFKRAPSPRMRCLESKETRLAVVRCEYSFYPVFRWICLKVMCEYLKNVDASSNGSADEAGLEANIDTDDGHAVSATG